MNIKIGFGVDVHQLVANRDLIVGGVAIPSGLGALGHSDADVLLHAICDAILGAVNLRDIGYHFSDKDPEFKGIDSKILLKESYRLVKEKGFVIGNVDATVILEQPKLNPHIIEMQNTIAETLETEAENVSIKATTHEKVDSFGKQEAIKAYAICLVTKS